MLLFFQTLSTKGRQGKPLSDKSTSVSRSAHVPFGGSFTYHQERRFLIERVDFSNKSSLAAEYWLAELAGTEKRDKPALPHIILAVVARLQIIEREIAAAAPAMPKVRLHTPSGQWLMLYASRLNRSGEHGQVAVMFEVAHPVEIAPLIMQAYHLTKREGEVTQLILRGCATTEIATTLRVSSNTVQDHLKAIFEKVDVRSRRELTGRIFAQQYQPHFAANAPSQPPFQAAPLDVFGRLVSLERPSSESPFSLRSGQSLKDS